MNSKLYSWKECNEFTIEEMWDLYTRYVNEGQVKLLSSFGFGRDRVQSAEGARIVTTEGRELLDFTGGLGVLNLGHNHPRILAARQEYQAQKRMEIYKNFFSPYVAGLSHNIASLLPDDLDVSYFCNSGSEAVEGAVKMAYKYHGGARKLILHSDISFHGKLLGAGSLTASPDVHFAFPRIPDTQAFIYDDIESVRSLVRTHRRGRHSKIYAIIVEPFSAGTLRECSSRFLSQLRELCAREDIVLIFDEVYSGWCKTGAYFAFMHHNVLPDVLCYSKSFGGGKSSIAGYTARVPVFRQAYGNLNDALLHGTTYNAMGEECVTAIEALRVMVDEDLPNQGKRIEARLGSGLRNLMARHPGMIQAIRGRGALQGVILDPGAKVLEKLTSLIPLPMFRDPRFMRKLVTAAVNENLYSAHGMLTYQGTGADTEVPLVLSPPLVVTDCEIDRLLTAMDETLSNGALSLVTQFAKKKLFPG